MGEYTGSGHGLTVMGNPPFGQAASGTIAFFNNAFRWADGITFIFPCSVRKFSVENQLIRHFYRVHAENVSAHAFLHDGVVHEVPTVFEIWERRTTPRNLKSDANTLPHFRFTTPELAKFVTA